MKIEIQALDQVGVEHHRTVADLQIVETRPDLPQLDDTFIEHIAGPEDRRMLLHGTLHLLGFDHEADAEAAAMETLESRILAEQGVADPYGAADDNC